MKKSFKILIVIAVFFSISSSIYCLNTEFNSEQNWFSYNNWPVISDLRFNPAVFVTRHDKDYTKYQLSGDQNNLDYKRFFDPDRTNQFNFTYQNLKILDEQSWLISTIEYNRLDHYGVNSSLERNYYDNYLSIIDSTTGNTTYEGPRIGVAYVRRLTGKLKWGINLDYFVERGLKDRFSSCLTITRFAQGGVGLGYTSADNRTVLGADFQYHSVQSNYEAVDDIYDAFITQYWGYYTTDPGRPYSKVVKIDTREGFDLSVQFNRKELLFSGVDVMFISTRWGQSSDVVIGTSSDPHPYGYWVREGLDWTGVLSIYPESSRFGGLISISNEYIDDWVETNKYSKLILTNNENKWSYAGRISYRLFNSLTIYGGYESSTNDTDYEEFLPDFNYDDKRTTEMASGGLNWKPGLLTNIWLEGKFGTIEPYYFWETDEFDVWTGRIRIEQNFLFGTLGIIFSGSEFVPAVIQTEAADPPSKITELNLEFYLLR